MSIRSFGKNWYQPDLTKIATAKGRWRYNKHFTYTYPKGSWDWYPEGTSILVYAETIRHLREGRWGIT